MVAANSNQNARFRSLWILALLLCLGACRSENDAGTTHEISQEDIENNCIDVASDLLSECRLALFDAADPIEIVEAPATGVALGWGWNRGDSAPIPTICVEFLPGEEPAQTRYMTMQEVHDTHDLMQSLGMSAEGSVKTAVYSVSGKANYAKSTKLSSERSTFVLNAVVQNGVRYASPIPEPGTIATPIRPLTTERGGTSGAIRLSSAALDIAREDLAKFQRICGSSFVSAIYGGAKLTATISKQAETKEEKESASLQMSGGGWGARLESNLKSSNTNASARERTDISIFLTGGKGDAIPASVNDLLQKLETISLDAYAAPKDFQVAITPYELVSNWPGKLLPDREDAFDALSSYWGAYNTLYHEIELIMSDPALYHELSTAHGELVLVSEPLCQAQRQQLKNITIQIQKIATNPFNEKVAKDHIAKIATAQVALQTCLAAENAIEVLHQPVDLARLRALQDMVLTGLRELEEKAQDCTERTTECEFDSKQYLDPYSLRMQLPLPVASQIKNVDDAIYHNVGRIAKSRCEESPNNPGCRSNAEIHCLAAAVGWRLPGENAQCSFAKPDPAKEKANSSTDAAEADTPSSASVPAAS